MVERLVRSTGELERREMKRHLQRLVLLLLSLCALAATGTGPADTDGLELELKCICVERVDGHVVKRLAFLVTDRSGHPAAVSTFSLQCLSLGAQVASPAKKLDLFAKCEIDEEPDAPSKDLVQVKDCRFVEATTSIALNPEAEALLSRLDDPPVITISGTLRGYVDGAKKNWNVQWAGRAFYRAQVGG